MSISTLRTQRDAALKASDFLMLPDVPLTTAEKEAAIAYRIMLRDVITEDMTDEIAAETDLPVADAAIADWLL